MEGTTSEKEKEELMSQAVSHPAETSQGRDAASVQLSKSAIKSQRRRTLKQSEFASAGTSEDDKNAHGAVGSDQSAGAASSADPFSSNTIQVKPSFCDISQTQLHQKGASGTHTGN